MFRNLFIGIALVFSASMAHAALHGEWNGWGDWVFQGSGTHCSTMNLKFSESENKLQRLGGLFDCGLVALHIEPQVFEKQGNVLLIDGKEVGSVNGGTYQWTEHYSDTVLIKNSLKVDGLHMDYYERWIGSDNEIIYEITGRLFLRGQ